MELSTWEYAEHSGSGTLNQLDCMMLSQLRMYVLSLIFSQNAIQDVVEE